MSLSNSNSMSRSIPASDTPESEDLFWKGPTVRPAHYSVSEYLLSSRIRTGPANAFALSEETGATFMARMCLRYLMLFNDFEPLNEDIYEDFQLPLYAAQWWHQHIIPAVIQHDPTTAELFRTLLDTKAHPYSLSSIRLSDPVYYPSRPHLHLQPTDLLSPLYYLCKSNASSGVVKFAVDLGFDVNVQAGGYGSHLQPAMIWSREINTLNILLEAGADVNALGGDFGTALNAAAISDFEEGVAPLLEAGADPCRR